MEKLTAARKVVVAVLLDSKLQAGPSLTKGWLIQRTVSSGWQIRLVAVLSASGTGADLGLELAVCGCSCSGLVQVPAIRNYCNQRKMETHKVTTWHLFTGVHVECAVSAVSLPTWFLFTGVPALFLVFGVRRTWPIGSSSPLCLLGVRCCMCGVIGNLAPVHRRAACVVPLSTWLLPTGVHAWCAVCAVSLATWLLFTGVPARCIVLRVRCPWRLGSCPPVCCVCGALVHLAPGHRCASLVCCVCDVLGHFAPVHRAARSVLCVACAVSLATWLMCTGVRRVRCPCPLGSCSRVCTPGVLCVHWPWPLCSCSPLCSLGVLCCAFDVLGHLAHVHLYARWLCCVVRSASLAPWLLFSAVHARSSVACAVTLATRLLFTGVQVRCAVCAVSLATWLLFTGIPARWVVLRVRCLWSLGSRLLVCPLSEFCYAFDVFGHFAPIHRCARSVCCVVRSASLAPWLLFPGMHARCVVLRAQCAWPLGLLVGGVTPPRGLGR